MTNARYLSSRFAFLNDFLFSLTTQSQQMLCTSLQQVFRVALIVGVANLSRKIDDLCPPQVQSHRTGQQCMRHKTGQASTCASKAVSNIIVLDCYSL